MKTLPEFRWKLNIPCCLSSWAGLAWSEVTHVVGHTSQEAHVASEMGKGGSSLIEMSPEYAELA